MVLARRSPKTNFTLVRLLFLATAVDSFFLLFLVLSSGGFVRTASAESQIGIGFGTALLFVLLLLPVALKSLGEDISRYRLATRRLVSRRIRVLYTSLGLAAAIGLPVAFLWNRGGRSVGDVMQGLALPFTLTLAIIELSIVWIIDRRVVSTTVRVASAR
jgi:hypothetical protein